ncbi:MAG: AraC family transcriptional regulator [Oscillospiraceae bacterium]
MENIITLVSIDETNLPLVYDCDILTASEGFYHIDRTADFNVLILVTDGIMYVTESDIDYEIGAGELLFLKNGLRHFGKHEIPRGTRWVYVHFSLPDENGIERVYLPKKICGLSGSIIEEKLYKLCESFHSSDKIQKFRSNAQFYDILLDLCSEQPKSESVTDKICAFLDTQTDKDFSKALISEYFYLSYSRLAAEFKREKGISMGQYHNAARMKRACHLLRSTLMSVGEIADELGFTDMLYFSKKFRTYVGVPPTDYRKQIQKKY